MWYKVAFANFFIWKADIWDSTFVLCDFDRVRRGDRGGRDNLPGETDGLQHWFMSILTWNMTREHYTDPHWPAGWSALLGGDGMGNKAFRWRWRTLQNSTEMPQGIFNSAKRGKV